ncbi:hypothetical protein AAHC03_020565 [Spirometra sp. Aus1]
MLSPILGVLLLLSQLVCGNDRGKLNEKITVYFCEEGKKTCESYEVYGRGGYADNFKRHVKCVRLCNIVGLAARSPYENFELCPRSRDSCTAIKKINGSFDVFKKCTSKCDGWPILENTMEDTALFGFQGGPPERLTFFSKPGAIDGFEDLKICLKNCISGDASTTSASESSTTLETTVAEEDKLSTEVNAVVTVNLDNESTLNQASSDGIDSMTAGLTESDQIDNITQVTYTHEYPPQPNPSVCLKVSYISVACFSILWPFSMVAL